VSLTLLETGWDPLPSEEPLVPEAVWGEVPEGVWGEVPVVEFPWGALPELVSLLEAVPTLELPTPELKNVYLSTHETSIGIALGTAAQAKTGIKSISVWWNSSNHIHPALKNRARMITVKKAKGEKSFLAKLHLIR
jgi:hypothetical protein